MDDKRTGRTALYVILAAAGTVLLVLAFLVSLIEGIGFDKSFYRKEYAQNGTASYVGVSSETLNGATDALLEYLQGKRASLNMVAAVNGTQREYYNEREKLHMADVRDLNLGAYTFMWVGSIGGALLLVISAVYEKKKYIIWETVFYSILSVLVFFGIIGAWASLEFQTFWTSFHHVFFSNDLWLFDPQESLLIRMFEQRFFFDMVGLILVWFLSGIGVGLLISGLKFTSGKKKDREAREAATQ